MTIEKLEGFGVTFTTVGHLTEGFDCHGDDIVIVSHKPLTSTYKHFGYERRHEAKLQIVRCRENCSDKSVYQEAAKHIAQLNARELAEDETGWVHSIIASGKQDHIQKMIAECLPEAELEVKAHIAAELEAEEAKARRQEINKQTADYKRKLAAYDRSDYSVGGWQKIVDTWKTQYPLADISD